MPKLTKSSAKFAPPWSMMGAFVCCGMAMLLVALAAGVAVGVEPEEGTLRPGA